MPRQQEIPGTELPHIEAIENAAQDYVKIRDRRMALTNQEISAKEKLMAQLLEHKRELSKNADGDYVYRFDDLLVLLKTGKDNVKVKAVDDDIDDSDED